MTARTKSDSKPQTAAMSDAMRKSMLQIWQAGLGAFSRAQSDGRAAYAKLVKDGARLEIRSRKLAADGAAELAQSARQIAGEAGTQAAGSWRKVETMLEKGVSDALHTLGVPVRKDLQALIDRIEALSATVESLTGQRSAASKPAAGAGRKKRVAAKAGSIRGTGKPAKVAPRALIKRASGSTPPHH